MWLDLEHVPNDLRDIGNQVRAAKMHDVDAMVRVPRGSYSDLIRPLEMDATGIMVPHVMSAAGCAAGRVADAVPSDRAAAPRRRQRRRRLLHDPRRASTFARPTRSDS